MPQLNQNYFQSFLHKNSSSRLKKNTMGLEGARAPCAPPMDPPLAGVKENIVLNVSAAILNVTRCLTRSQWSDLRSGLASVRPSRWQTTLGCSSLAAVHRKSQRWCTVEHGTDDTARCCLSQVVGEQGTHVTQGACMVVARPRWRDSRIAGASRLLRRVTSVLAQPAACCRRAVEQLASLSRAGPASVTFMANSSCVSSAN